MNLTQARQHINKQIKNYKELCSILEIPEKGGKGKQYQLEDIQRYILLDRIGNKYIIKEIYSEPLTKIDNRINNNKQGKNNSKYIEQIQYILTDYIYRNRDDTGKVILSFSKLLNILGLVNNTYTVANSRKKELSDILNIEIRAIYYFYNNTRSEFKNIIERALNNLQKRSVIHYTKRIIIAEKIEIDNEKYINCREADNDEVKAILDAQRHALESLQLKDLQSLFLAGSGKYKEYIKTVMSQLPEDYIYYFNAYELIVGEYAIQSEYNNIYKTMKELNKKSIDRVGKILKVTDKNDNEQKLIDSLIDIINYDFKLDERIKYLYLEHKKEKENKISEKKKELQIVRQQEQNIKEEIEYISKIYDEGDSISFYDLYSYSDQLKEKYSNKELIELFENELLK